VTARACAQPASAQLTAETTPARAGRCCDRARWAGRKIEQCGAGQPQWEVVVEMTREGQCTRGAAREAQGAGRDDI